jgi:hypothetical protein
MDKSNIPFSVLLHAEEVRLRGLYLTITVDLEQVLNTLIAHCFRLDTDEIKTFYHDKNGKGKDLSKLTLEQKVEVCKKGLDKYFPKEFKEHDQNFTSIDTLRQVRNKFAHDKIDDFISPNDLTKLTLHKLKTNLKVLSTEYAVSFLYKELFAYKDTMQDTLRLMAKVMGYPNPTF